MKQYNLSKSYRKAFILTPEALTKLIEVLVNGLRKPPGNIALNYAVNRVDGTNYSCDTLDRVLGDTNISGHKIESLSVEISDTNATDEHSLNGWLRFDTDPSTESPVTVSVHDSRATPVEDSFTSDLLPFVERCLVGSERKLGVPKWIHAFLLPVLLLVMAFCAAQTYIPAFSRPITELPFSQFALQLSICLFIVIAAFGICNDLEIPKAWHKFLGRQSVFAWGDEAVAYKRREAIREKIVWVVVIGLGVSLVAGFVGSWLFRLFFG